MRSLIRLLSLGALLVLSQKSHAVVCARDEIHRSDYMQVNTTVAISSTMSKDTVVWRSPTRTITVTCWIERVMWEDEDVYIYPSPGDIGGMALGDDLEVGVHINGEDHRYSAMKESPEGWGRRVKIDNFALGICPNDGGCRSAAQTRSLSFNFFFSKKSEANPHGQKEGRVTHYQVYDILQLDGKKGLNNTPGATYRIQLDGMDNLRYVACDSTISLSHATINFGGLNKDHAQRNQIAAERPFSITARKDCDSAYALGAFLKPINGSVNKAKEMLIPDDNYSIGITLHDKDNNQSLVPFNQEFELVKHSTDRTVVRNFIARATWLTDKANTKLGKFNAGATIDIYYK